MFNLLEDPTLLVVGGVIIEVLLLVSVMQTGRGALLGGMGVVALVVAAGWGLERLVVTDREGVETALYDTADALETNDIDKVLEHVAKDAREVRTRLALIIPHARIEQAKIRDLDIQLQANTDPKTARVTLRGIIHGAASDLPYDTLMRRFAVRLRQEGEKWLITDYEELGQDGAGGLGVEIPGLQR